MEDFKDTLKDLLIDNNLTPMDLSKAIGVSHTTVGDWLINGATPTLVNLFKISDYFNCSIDYLLNRTDTKTIYASKTQANFFDRLNELIYNNNSNPCQTMRACKLRTSDYYDWKYGKLPMLEKIIILANHFDCSVDYLVGRSDSI